MAGESLGSSTRDAFATLPWPPSGRIVVPGGSNHAIGVVRFFDTLGSARDNPRVSFPLGRHASAPTAVYADVALVPALPGKDLLSYRLADVQREYVRPGMRVLVPLGRRRETGIVVALGGTPPIDTESIRVVLDVLDAEPIFTPELFALCRWAADYYVTTLADVLAAALPGGLRATSARLVRLTDEATPVAARRPTEGAVIAHLRTAGASTTRQLARVLGERGVAAAIRALAARGAILVEDQVRAPAGGTRWIATYVLTRALADADLAALARRAPRQHTVYERLRALPAEGLAASHLTLAERTAAEALVRKGIAGRRRAERYRDTLPPPAAAAAIPTLTAAQRHAVETIAAASGFATFLLHGVTGSGKTEVYLQIASRVHAAGRSVLVLVPEIALTHQLVLRVQERFGSGVALLHSGLSPGERWDEWRRVARGEARVVVGARSALFAPLADLGLVIVDEEHDAAYKQEEGLRYHARDLALVRAKLAGATAILGSATPSLESYQQALTGKFRLLELAERVAGRAMPAVEIVDLREAQANARGTRAGSDEVRPEANEDQHEPTRKHVRGRDAGATWPGASVGAAAGRPSDARSALFSPPLIDAISATLARGEQVLLFLNRRGLAASLQCLGCGQPAGCPSCSVTLTLHGRRGVLLCHHCGYARPARAVCASCGRADLRPCGEGTERIEDEVTWLFPAARVGRLDRDTTARKGAHRRILDAWRDGALDVLIGTQMVAKGHDVAGVTLVGVLLADVALNLPDFRAAERAFQLLTQVAGRAGRGTAPGRVVVQTFRPDHHSLVAAAMHDYKGFAPRELAFRQELGYPPFARFAILRLEGANGDATAAAANDLAARARTAAGPCIVRGPAPAPLERLRGRYRWQVMLASRSVRALHTLIRAVIAAWQRDRRNRTIRLVVDIDPVSML